LRGNLYMKHSEINETFRDLKSETNVQKNVFIVFAHGREILVKIKKIAESLRGNVYEVDPNFSERDRDLVEVNARIEDLNNVIHNTDAQRRIELLKLAEILDQWQIIVKKEKGIYNTLNMFNYDSTRKCLIGEGWCPTQSISAIQYALHAASERSGSNVPPILNELSTREEPPTFQKTNKFTKGFQTIIDAYGIARYKEVNPGLFTVITFPFLFAIMFGDFGHGVIMFLFAMWMLFREEKLLKSKKDEVCFNSYS
jgi:V-type H+-transporting ATPase subunit a